MEFFDVLHSRRSIRQFTGEPLVAEQVDTLLRAAMAAPSAGNARPWEFVVIDERAMLEKIPSIHPYAAMAPHAGVAILVCGDPTAEKHAGFWVQDCAAATQNILLAARALDLGAVWTGLYPVEERIAHFQLFAGLPQKIIPFACVVIGHTKLDQQPKDRFEPKKIHHNRW